MSWSKCCYLYSQERSGMFIGNYREGELIFPKGTVPISINYFLAEGRYGVSRIQASAMVDMGDIGEYELMIGAQSKKALGGLKAALLGRGYDAELQRRISTNDEELTQKVLEEGELKRILHTAPQYIVKVYPGPEGTHLLKVYCLNPESPGSDWPDCAVSDDYTTTIDDPEIIREKFFPEMDRLLSVTRAARSALMGYQP